MIGRLTYFESRGGMPFHNQAAEECLLSRCEPGECILYLWQNQRTVVIGRNQDAWSECRVERLEADGGYLARRMSGGGAVYHDLGNLNYSFLSRRCDHDVERQTGVVQKALEHLGLETEKSGWNDIQAAGRKFSGNAFYENGDRCCHHGTLMVDVDMQALDRYLAVPQEKLSAKGIRSVRSRVVNLDQLLPGLTVEAVKTALRAAFEQAYGRKSRSLCEEELRGEELEASKARFASEAWRYGHRPSFQRELVRRFPWGQVSLRLLEENGQISVASIYSDALRTGLIGQFREAQREMGPGMEAACAALELCRPEDDLEAEMKRAMLAWLREQEDESGERTF